MDWTACFIPSTDGCVPASMTRLLSGPAGPLATISMYAPGRVSVRLPATRRPGLPKDTPAANQEPFLVGYPPVRSFASLAARRGTT